MESGSGVQCMMIMVDKDKGFGVDIIHTGTDKVDNYFVRACIVRKQHYVFDSPIQITENKAFKLEEDKDPKGIWFFFLQHQKHAKLRTMFMIDDHNGIKWHYDNTQKEYVVERCMINNTVYIFDQCPTIFPFTKHNIELKHNLDALKLWFFNYKFMARKEEIPSMRTGKKQTNRV